MAVARGAAAGVAMTGSESGIARNRNGKAMSAVAAGVKSYLYRARQQLAVSMACR